MSQPASPWLEEAVATFGIVCRDKLAGPGDREAAIRSPIEGLLGTAGDRLGLHVVPHDEVRDTNRGVRPDYAISVAGAITGYVEVKRPGLPVDPARSPVTTVSSGGANGTCRTSSTRTGPNGASGATPGSSAHPCT